MRLYFIFCSPKITDLQQLLGSQHLPGKKNVKQLQDVKASIHGGMHLPVNKA